jgi:hypothetical protein
MIGDCESCIDWHRPRNAEWDGSILTVDQDVCERRERWEAERLCS